MDGYTLTRTWFEYSIQKHECKPIHSALFMFIVYLNNELRWIEQFGLPTHATMQALSIGNKKTYLTALRDLKAWGFIDIIKESQNQYQSCIIKICCGDAVALSQQHCNSIAPGTDLSTGTGTAPIIKHINNKTNKQINDNDILIFENFRKGYPGTKRGLETEFRNFQKHKDWHLSLPLLLPALLSQIKWRTTQPEGNFIPNWKNLQTWINNRSWEEEHKVFHLPQQRKTGVVLKSQAFANP